MRHQKRNRKEGATYPPDPARLLAPSLLHDLAHAPVLALAVVPVVALIRVLVLIPALPHVHLFQNRQEDAEDIRLQGLGTL